MVQLSEKAGCNGLMDQMHAMALLVGCFAGKNTHRLCCKSVGKSLWTEKKNIRILKLCGLRCMDLSGEKSENKVKIGRNRNRNRWNQQAVTRCRHGSTSPMVPERSVWMKIMICGSGGQLGWDCIRVFEREHQVSAFNRNDLDICDARAVEQTVAKVSPDVVINCAAFTQVDQCETHEDIAFQVNALGPENLARACFCHGARLIHVSTDYVFDGDREPPLAWTEADEARPVSVYGRTKREGEIRVARTLPDHAILRTAWLYGARGNNFFKNHVAADPCRTGKGIIRWLMTSMAPLPGHCAWPCRFSGWQGPPEQASTMPRPKGIVHGTSWPSFF